MINVVIAILTLMGWGKIFKGLDIINKGNINKIE